MSRPPLGVKEITKKPKAESVRPRMNYPGRNRELVNKIKVYNGRLYGERWIMQQLYKQDIDDFKPISVTTNPRGDVEFYIKSIEAADAVRAVSGRIVHQKTGKRVTFKIERCPAPWTRLSTQEVKVINEVVDKRYNKDSNAIDLSEFFLDPVFTAKDMHMLLTKNNVLLTVLDRIDEKHGSITGLSLKGNRLKYLDFCSMLVYTTKFVKVLDLSHNMIENMEQLEKLRGIPVKILFFEGNPACQQFTQSSDYLNAVHLAFPKCLQLDGQDVPLCAIPELLDDDEIPKAEIPPKHGFFFDDNNIRQLLESFANEYYNLYDGLQGSATRKKLVPAYDENSSTFTLTLQMLRDVQPIRYNNTDNYTFMIRASHNILRQERWERHRAGRIFKGAMEIAVHLAKMPLTKHYRESFVVDVHLKTPTLLGFSLQGLFEEAPFAENGKIPVLNYFSRSFYVAPREGNSVAIISDMLFISAIHAERMARYQLLMKKISK